MANRATAAGVGAIIELDVNIADITPFITAANAIVTEVCASFTGYTATHLGLIETWLSAHFYTQRDPRMSREIAKGVGASYQSVVDLGLNNSHYGQMAMRLDWNGGLATLEKQTVDGKPRTVSVNWVGSTEDE